MEERQKSVCIVLLGDIGRSPRMNYHALSLAQEGYAVHFIGYTSSAIPKDLVQSKNVTISGMAEPPTFINKIPRMLAYPLKVAWQMLFLSWAFVSMLLVHQFRPDFILLQNPPAIPTLPVSWLFSVVLWADLVVDWHNYGFSLMQIQHGDRLIVRVSKWIEDTFGAKGNKHLCVTKAMREDLKNRLNVDAVTLYDRAPEFFKPLNSDEKRAFLLKLSSEYEMMSEVADKMNEKNRPGILISSTSWTEDEDFNILLSALKDYEEISEKEIGSYPKLVVFITGKGPLKEEYRKVIEKMPMNNVSIYLPWLEQEDYPKLLACADLGVSLHYSSSGLDLPMKVVDMFGCGLPVAAANFNCISELVRHEENGFVFKDAQELGDQIQGWFKISEKGNPRHEKFRNNLKSFQSIRWHQNWKTNAMSLFT